MNEAASERTAFAGPSTVAIGVDDGGRIDWVAGDAERLLGWAEDQLVGQPLTTLIPERFHSPHLGAFERYMSTGELRLGGQPLVLPARRLDGTEIEVELQLAVRSGDDGRGVVGVLHPATAAHLADEPLVAGMREHIEKLVAADHPLAEIVATVMGPICDDLGWAIGVVWAVDPWIERLTAVHVWERELGRHAVYVDATKRSRFSIGEGFAGTVWRTSSPWWTDDVTVEHDFHRAEAAAAAGLRSALFFPILFGSGVVGMVELVDDRRRGVDAETHRSAWALATEFGRHLGERFRRESERAHRQRLELALRAGRTGLWTYHAPSGQVTWDALCEEAHGIAVGSFGGTFDAFVDRIEPDDRDHALAIVGGAIATGDDFEIGYRTVGDDGAERWIEGAGTVVVDHAGEMQVMAGVCRDVTARVRDRELLERRAVNAALAADAGHALVANGTLDERLDRTVSAVVEHLGVAFARVWTLADGDDTLRLRASAGMYTHLDGEHACIRVGDYKIGRIADNRQSHVTNDVLHDEQISDPAWARREGMRAFVGFPLLVGHRCVGVVAVFSRHELTDDVVSSLGSITNSIAVAISQDEESSRALELLEETRRQHAYAEELLADRHRVASVLQASLLPPELPEIDGVELAAAYRSGVEAVGGDFYDVLPLGPGRYGIFIGDVCGRGPEAARLTALARHTLRTALLLGRGPASALELLDTAFRAAVDDGRFCTVACGVLDHVDDELAQVRLAIAGHPPPQVVRADGTVEGIERTGPIVGVLPDVTYGKTDVALAPGDSIVFYTDGIIEAHGADGLFGSERLVACLAEHHVASADEMTQSLLSAVNAYDDMRTRDDLAILTVRRTSSTTTVTSGARHQM